MSTADRVIPAAEAEVLAKLSRLARKGAYATPAEGDAEGRGQYAVFSPRNGFARPIATIPEGLLAYARRQGWLEEAQDGTRLRLTPAGARALRRARSGAGTEPACRQRNEGAADQAGRPAATPGGGRQESPLQWLRRRKDKDGRPLISEAQFSAGERLSTDYWRAQLTPRVTANWSASATSRRERRAGPGVGIDLADGVVAARERVARALRAVGPELASVLVDVCCLEMGLQAAGRENAWPQRTTRIVLDLALRSLARHYGLIPPEPSPGASRLRHWGEEGYRPTLDAWRG
jgi:hypothetical protein